jgi:hypothetical protein
MQINEHKNRIKDKNHVILSTDPEKTFDTIEHPFMKKISEESRN